MKNSSSLTPKEKEVLKCIKQEKCKSEIASLHSVRQSTVKFYVHNIIDKHNATDRAPAVAISLEKGLFDT